jgi:hypothetical protein
MPWYPHCDFGELRLYPIGWQGYPIELGFGVPGATTDPTRRGFCLQIWCGLKERQRLTIRACTYGTTIALVRLRAARDVALGGLKIPPLAALVMAGGQRLVALM